MRTIVGLIAVLGLAVAAAHAQPPRERAAAFRPPEPLGPNDRPPAPVARGASEEPPPAFPSTPVARPGKADGRGPAWLTGVDPNVLPAAGNTSTGDYSRTLTPAPLGRGRDKEDPFTLPKGLEKLRGGSRAPSAATPPAEQPTATTPFRGTAANGAPVYAGPPAYRWYGWGTVTPGANQFAPTGQYPKASANWYSITGATPGAFPVPVMNPLRTPPGTEPPSYATARPSANPATVVSASGTPTAASQYAQPAPPVHSQPQPQPQPLPLERPQPSKFNPTGESKFVPAEPTSPQVNVPKLTPPPATAALVPPPPPVLPPAVPETTTAAPSAPQLPVSKPQPVAAAPQVAPSVVIPPPEMPAPGAVFPSVEPAKPVSTDVPGPLPMSVRSEPKPAEPKRPAPPREEQKWQAAPEPAQPPPGTWAPVTTRPAQPPAPTPAPTNDVPAWKSSSTNVKPIVARGAAPDSTPDPIETLIQQLCRGRASGIEIRWAGTKKLMVCFEVRTPTDAQQLVSDISKRPELAPYQIDFCAVVKK